MRDVATAAFTAIGLGLLLSSRMRLFAHLEGPAWALVPFGAAWLGFVVGRVRDSAPSERARAARLVLAGITAALGVGFEAAPRLDQTGPFALALLATAVPFASAAATRFTRTSVSAGVLGFLAAPWIMDGIGGPPPTDGVAGILLAVAAASVASRSMIGLRVAGVIAAVALAFEAMTSSADTPASGTRHVLRQLGVGAHNLASRRWTSRSLEERVRLASSKTWTFHGADAPVPDAPLDSDTRDVIAALAIEDPLIAMLPVLAPDTEARALGSFPSASEARPSEATRLLVIASTHVRGNGRDDAGYSRAKFERAWQRVPPNGALAWLASDEAVFLRGLLTIGEVTELPLAQHAWGFGVDAAAGSASPFRYLALLPKRAPAPDDAERLARVGAPRSVRILFGPPLAGRGTYASLADADGIERARERLRREISGRSRRWVTLESATLQRPSFAWTSHASPLPWRVTVAAGVMGLLVALVLPSPGRRRADAPDAARALPLPLLSATPAAFAAAALLSIFAMTYGASILVPSLDAGSATVILTIVVGSLSWRDAARALRALASDLPDLAPGALVACGCAALAASALGPWLLFEQGVRAVAAAAAVAWLAAFALSQAFARR